MGISVEELKKALSSLKEALALYESETMSSPSKKAYRDACIQRFEYSIEIAWKTSMKVLGSQTTATRPALREMARSGLIESPENWFLFVDARNQSSHSYDEATAQKVFSQIKLFVPEALKLVERLEANN